MKLEPRGSFSFIILFLKLVWYVDNYFSFEVPAGTITAVNAKLSLLCEFSVIILFLCLYSEFKPVIYAHRNELLIFQLELLVQILPLSGIFQKYTQRVR